MHSNGINSTTYYLVYMHASSAYAKKRVITVLIACVCVSIILFANQS